MGWITPLAIQTSNGHIPRSATERAFRLYKPRSASGGVTLKETDMSKTQIKPQTITTPRKKPTKAALVVNLLKRKSGASLEELTRATGWQPHSVRGFLSGTVRKRMGMALVRKSAKNGTHRYYVTGKPTNMVVCKLTCEPPHDPVPKAARAPSEGSSEGTPIIGDIS